MNRWRAPLLDALYGMDLLAPDWTPVFDLLSRTFRSPVIAVQIHDTMHRHGQITTASALSDALLQHYETLSREHPWFERGTDKLLAAGIADDRGLMTEAELKATRFYGEFLQPARIGHGMALCMHHQGPANLAVLTINRDWQPGHFDEREWEQARSLLPHLRNVYLLQQRLGWLDSQSQRFRAALDHLSDGVLLLDVGGRLLFCNTAAQQMEAGRLFVRRPDGRLGMLWSADDRLLQHILRQLCAPGAVAPRVLRLHGPDGRLTGMLKLCPTDRLAGTQWSEFQVRVIAFVESIALAASTVGPQLQAQWGFTPAEAQLARWLMQGFSLDEAAEHLGVTKNTVRTQLRSLFDKTETRRQAELMRVLLQLSHV